MQALNNILNAPKTSVPAPEISKKSLNFEDDFLRDEYE
jgi:hypothetical protein